MVSRVGRQTGSASAAGRAIHLLWTSFQVLLDFPDAGRARDDEDPRNRRFVADEYLVFYRVMEDEVEILRIFHAREDVALRRG